MDTKINGNGQMNGQQAQKAQVVNNGKSIWANESFRRGVATGAGATIGGAALYFVGKVLIGKVKAAIAAKKAAKEAAPAEQPAK